MRDIGSFIKPKTVPVRSIAPTRIDEDMPMHSMTCACSMCR